MLLRIGDIAQAVAEKVETENQQSNRQPGKHRQVRRIEQMHAPAAEHRSPARCRRLHTKAQKTQRGLADDRSGHPERRLHHDRWCCGRYDVPQKQARRRRAERTGGLHVLEFARSQHLAAHQPCKADPTDRGERQQRICEARTEHSHERDGQQEAALASLNSALVAGQSSEPWAAFGLPEGDGLRQGISSRTIRIFAHAARKYRCLSLVLSAMRSPKVSPAPSLPAGWVSPSRYHAPLPGTANGTISMPDGEPSGNTGSNASSMATGLRFTLASLSTLKMLLAFRIASRRGCA